MKIALTKKIKIDLNRRTMVIVFAIAVIALTGFLAFMGYITYSKQGTAEEIKKETNISVNKTELEKVEEYVDRGTLIDINVGLGKSEPFK